MSLNKKYRFPLLILLIGFISVNQWSQVPVGNTYVIWIIQFLTLGYLIKYINKHEGFYPNRDYILLCAYLLVLLEGTIRGVFVAENYWEWKQLVVGTMALSLPLFIYVFKDPEILGCTLRFWYKWGIRCFFIFFIWTIPSDVYHFYLGPILLIGCFLPVITSKKWKLIIIFFLFMMMFADFGARSQVVKAVICFMMSFAYFFAKYMTDKLLRIAHWICYIVPVVLLILGITGIFNIFEDLSTYRGKVVEKKVVNGQIVEDDLAADTRTFIYVEVIGSALRNDYFWWGRTPARGNDSVSFGAYSAEELKIGKYERHRNEVCHPNVFTWLGFIGMLLYSLLYLQASRLAVYRSRNLLIKLMGVYVAFRWAYGWIEDINDFSILSITLWMMIAMCFSVQFRNMTDKEMKCWINSLLDFKKKVKLKYYEKNIVVV